RPCTSDCWRDGRQLVAKPLLTEQFSTATTTAGSQLMMKCFAWACLLGSLCATMPVRSAHGYIAMGRWSATAQNPSTGTVGSAVNLTWSIVPDGTWIPSKLAPSNLVARLDEQWGTGPGGSDLTQRPWFGLFQQS